MIRLRTQLERRFTLRFLNHLVELPFSFFQQRSLGDLMVRLSSNDTIRNMLTSAVLSTFMDGTMASVYLLLLILANAPMTLVVMLMAAARPVLVAIFRWRQRPLLDDGMDNQARSQTVQAEFLSGIETLKAMGLEQREADKWSSIFVDGLDIAVKRSQLDAMVGVIVSLLETVSRLAMMFYGAYLVIGGVWTLGTMMAFNAIAAGFLGPVSNLFSSVLQLQMLEVYLERLNDVMDSPAEQETNAVVPAGPLLGGIKLEGLTFRYRGQDTTAIEDVSFVIPPGARIALAGRTGSGKSTLARLLAGLYAPTSGRVLLDGKDWQILDRRSARRQLGIVTQETHLFGGSIRSNISLSDPEMGLEQVVRAAKLACIHDEIIAMPMKYETLLSDRGQSLSGGERQRMALARALAASPKILILDEATSHLDGLTEGKIIHNLFSLRCTMIIIAHRLSTVRDADCILVLEGGRLIEQGRHEELSRAGGYYSRLVCTQSYSSVMSHKYVE